MKVVRKRKTKQPKRKERPPLPPPTPEGFIDIASRAGSIYELQILWRNAREMGLLTPEVRDVMSQRATWLKTQSEEREL